MDLTRTIHKGDILNVPLINELPLEGWKEIVETIVEELDSYVVYRFSGIATNISNAQYIWDFDDPYATEKNPNIQIFNFPFSTVSHLFRVAGTYHIRYMVKTEDYIIEAVKCVEIKEEELQGGGS